MNGLIVMLLEAVQPHRNGGIIQYISSVVNGSCYQCLSKPSTWTKYFHTFSGMNSSNPNYLFSSIFFGILFLILVLITVFVIYRYDRRVHKSRIIFKNLKRPTQLAYAITLMLVVGLTVKLLMFHVAFTSTRSSFHTVTNRTVFHLELFLNHTLLESGSRISIDQVMQDASSIINTTVITIMTQLMRSINADKMFARAPQFIANLGLVNDSFHRLSRYTTDEHPNILKFLGHIETVSGLLFDLGLNSSRTASCVRIGHILQSVAVAKPTVVLTTENSILISKIQQIVPISIDIVQIKKEMNDIMNDIDRVAPDSLRDFKRDIPLEMITQKRTEILFKTAEMTGDIHRFFSGLLVESKKVETYRCILEMAALTFQVVVNAFQYFLILTFTIRPRLKSTLSSPALWNIFPVSFATIASVVFTVSFIFLAIPFNEAFRYFRTGTNGLAILDKIASENVNLLWARLKSSVEQLSGDYNQFLRLPRTLPVDILQTIQRQCNGNNSILSILNFQSIIRFRELRQSEFFRKLVQKSKLNADKQIVEVMAKIKVPSLDAQYESIIHDFLKKLLDANDNRNNLKSIRSILNYFDWLKLLANEMRVTSCDDFKALPPAFLMSLHSSIDRDLKMHSRTVENALSDFETIRRNLDLPEKFRELFPIIVGSQKYMKDINLILKIFEKIFEKELDIAFDKLLGFGEHFFRTAVIGGLGGNCTMFLDVINEVSGYCDVIVATNSILLAVILEILIYFIIIWILYTVFYYWII